MWPFKRRMPPTILIEIDGGEVYDVLADEPMNVRVVILDHDKPSVEEHYPPRFETGWSIERLGKKPPSDRAVL